MASSTTPPIAATDPLGSVRVQPRPSGIVLLLVLFALVSHFNRMSIATAGDARIMAEYQISPTRMGMVYSAFLLAYTACMIPGGLFIDRFGPKAALAVVGFGSAGFVALTGVIGMRVRETAMAFAALVIVRALMGVVSAPLHPSCARAVGQWVAPGARSRTNGLVNGAALVGIAITPLGFGALINRFHWPSAFLIGAGLTTGLALVWTWYAKDRPAEITEAMDLPSPPIAWRSLLTDRSLLLLTVSYGAVSYFQYLFFYWMTHYFQNELHLSESRSRSYAAIPPLMMAAGMPLGGWLSDRLERSVGTRWGRRIIPMVGMTAGALLLVLGVRARDPAWIVAWFGLALGAVGMAEGPFWATAVELGGYRGGSAAAILNTGGNAGGMVAPVITPWVGDHYGWDYAVGLGGVICVAGVVLWLGINPVAGKSDLSKT